MNIFVFYGDMFIKNNYEEIDMVFDNPARNLIIIRLMKSKYDFHLNGWKSHIFGRGKKIKIDIRLSFQSPGQKSDTFLEMLSS